MDASQGQFTPRSPHEGHRHSRIDLGVTSSQLVFRIIRTSMQEFKSA